MSWSTSSGVSISPASVALAYASVWSRPGIQVGSNHRSARASRSMMIQSRSHGSALSRLTTSRSTLVNRPPVFSASSTATS